MPKIKVMADNFTLMSTWYCYEDSYGTIEIQSGPTTDSRSVTFLYDLPMGVEVKSAKVHADWGNPLSGFATRTINGVTPDENGFVDVEIDPEATSIDVVFRFKANGNTTSTGNREAAAAMTDVYLLIETSGGGIYLAENGVLVPYNFFYAANGVLVPYQLIGTPGEYEEDPNGQQFYTASGERFCTVDGQLFKITD